MLKFFGRKDIVRDEEIFDGSSEYRHLEFYTTDDTKTGHDIERPIENLYENQFQIIKFLEELAAKTYSEDGVFSSSYTDEFTITSDDIVQVTINSVEENYVRIPPGVAAIKYADSYYSKHNPIIVVNTPSLKLAERQIAKILGMNLPSGRESIEIKYFETTDVFTAKIIKTTSGTTTNYYYGCSDETTFLDGSVGKATGVELLVDMYNEVDFLTFFVDSLAGDITKIILEPVFKITAIDVYYFYLDKTDGEIKMTTTDPVADATKFQLTEVDITNISSGTLAGTPDNTHVGVGANPAVSLFQYEEATTVNGHALTTATWNTVQIATSKRNEIGATLATNTISLDEGIYDIEAMAIGYQTGGHKIRLYDTTNTTVLLTGLNSGNGAATAEQTKAVLVGQITLTGTAVLRLDHYAVSTGTNGMAISDGGQEVYAYIKITQRG